MSHPRFSSSPGRRPGDPHGGDEGPRLRHQHAPQQGRERRRHHQRESVEEGVLVFQILIERAVTFTEGILVYHYTLFFACGAACHHQ